MMGTTNQQAMEMMQKLMQKKTKPMPKRGERTAKNKSKKDKK
jgi:hypothetical protein